ncbi:MAG: OmpH family outer membrane protein [Sedimentisphaerales bacterium]|jgi:Skp family chaperone for outer membrane proteins
MKLKSTVFVVLTTAIIICAAIVAPRAGKAASSSKDSKCLKIGVVSVRKIFQDCRRNVKYRQEMTAERDKMEAELEKLSKEIDLGKTSMKALKPSSSDYAALMKEILDKQGRLQAQQEFFKRQMDMRQRGVMEELYKDIIKATAEVAKSKDFDMVLEKSEPDLPADNSDQLTIEISTNKVLYNAGCEDITDAVLVKVDAAEKGS